MLRKLRLMQKTGFLIKKRVLRKKKCSQQIVVLILVSGLPPDLENLEKALNFEMDLENFEN